MIGDRVVCCRKGPGGSSPPQSSAQALSAKSGHLQTDAGNEGRWSCGGNRRGRIQFVFIV